MLNLVVIRSADLERSKSFYEAIGLQFSKERHGSGPDHWAAQLGNLVFEIYPRSSRDTVGVRLGFEVGSMDAALSALQQLGAEIKAPPIDGPWGLRAVVIDPDGHHVEITQASKT